jgi:adenylate cyclase, class 2
MMSVKNLEAKFKLEDLAIAETRAKRLGYTRRAVLNQRDTFFVVARGKLKLREEGDSAKLIFYSREESGPLKLSSYDIVAIPEAAATCAMLTQSLGVIAAVTKERLLLMRDNLRLHLDRVEGLGAYGEIEAVIAEGDDPEDSRAAVDGLLAALEIQPADLIDVSYFELLLAREP